MRVSQSRQDFEIFQVICSKNGIFRYFWGNVQGVRNFFSQMLSFNTTLSLQNELLISHERFFSQIYGHIKFLHLSEQPYKHSHWLFGAYHSAFENLSWKFVLAGIDGLWIRIYVPPACKLVFWLQLTVAQCSILRYRGMKCKNWTAHAPIKIHYYYNDGIIRRCII